MENQKLGFVTGARGRRKWGKGMRMVQGGGTYLDAIESCEHAQMGLAYLGNYSNGGHPREQCLRVRRAPRVTAWPLFRRGAR